MKKTNEELDEAYEKIRQQSEERIVKNKVELDKLASSFATDLQFIRSLNKKTAAIFSNMEEQLQTKSTEQQNSKPQKF